MKLAIDQIRINEETRIRKDIGDLKQLETSIAAVGLINPILIDETQTLVAGYRRLRACRNLGWKEIDVTVVELEGDELRQLEAEVAENLYRKDFTVDEILATQTRREAIIESRRKKGIFERFWRWLKRLFGGAEQSPATVAAPSGGGTAPPIRPEAAATPDQSDAGPAAGSTATDSAGDHPGGAAAADRQPDDKSASQPPDSETGTRPIQPAEPVRPKTPEITEKDGIRRIKWR